MNDVLTLVPSDEHAPFRAISDVLGRVEQLANFRNRHGIVDGISPHTINEILIPHVRRFRMRLRGPESFEFAVILDPSATSEQRAEAHSFARKKLRAILIEKDMDNVTFDVRQVEDIPVDLKSGKFRLICGWTRMSRGLRNMRQGSRQLCVTRASVPSSSLSPKIASTGRPSSAGALEFH